MSDGGNTPVDNATLARIDERTIFLVDNVKEMRDQIRGQISEFKKETAEKFLAIDTVLATKADKVATDDELKKKVDYTDYKYIRNIVVGAVALILVCVFGAILANNVNTSPTTIITTPSNGK